MIVEETFLKDCLVIQPKVFKDERGYFYESFNLKIFQELTGIKINFVQDNRSQSSIGVLRGLHFQKGIHEQAKLVSVIKGKVLDVVVDLRMKSSTFGKHFSIILDDKKHQQLFIPRGFAHGFLVLEDNTIFSYKCDNYYNKESESGIIFNDCDLAISWDFPFEKIILSNKDQSLQTFKSYCLDI